ncbi:MAG TPA: bi-domain-containing oxidoreductase [Candidatus Margulisiibacteriota bacterium]|nr:bi-domain-containing oxidoreductase [Candidatus Margulisiibacteriota bacterium]
MKQILQHLRSGEIELAEVPCPIVRPRHLLIHTAVSLISPGTERMLVEFGQAGLIGKARSQPERVRQVLDKIKSDGVMPTLEAIFSRLDEPLPLGYCNVGRVLEVGAGVEGFSVGDRVASNGPHAEVVCVPATLAGRIPDAVDDEAASFTVLGAVALNGIRLLEPTLGESFVVVGLGLLGMLAVQLLRAHGCKVLGIDVNPARCTLARGFGCEVLTVGNGADPLSAARAFSHERGVDGVLITASAKTDDIVHQAAQMSRRRGRIVLVGVVGLGLQRSDFYEKELSFQVACSYGPGRYDPNYEGRAQDYPLPYVRWTAARNFEAVLESLASGAIEVRPLITHRREHADAAHAYDAILQDSETLGVVLSYPQGAAPTARVTQLHPPAAVLTTSPARPTVGVIGAGNFTKQVLLPAIKAAGATIAAVASAGGVTSLHAARKFAAEQATSDYQEILRAPGINAVFVATRHDTHARIVVEALQAGKHVFVEKPLAIDPQGLELVRAAYAAHSDRLLMVGFNRRFAPHAIKAQQLLAGRSQPIAVRIMVNAGAVPATHWVRDPLAGGGRIIGEACHFIDLALFLVGHAITGVQAMSTTHLADGDASTSISLTFSDGSIASIDYWTNGPRSYPKERVEIFSQGRVLTIDNWRALQAHEWPGVSRMGRRQDKGHGNEVAAFLRSITTGGAPLIPFAEIEMVTAASFAAVQSAAEGVMIRLAAPTTQQSNPRPPRSQARQARHDAGVTRRKIILYELNEVPWRIVDDFVHEHPRSCLARLLPQMQQYQTYANDTSLSPWISWSTLHRGVSDEQHTISDFGQDLSEINAAYPSIWEILTRAQVPSGVFGSLYSYPLPANLSDYSFYLPDVFAASSECFPARLQRFQALNLEMTRSSGRNVSTKLSWQKALRVLADAPALGLKPKTLLELGLQIADERRRTWTRVRRRTYQVVLAFDIFMKQLERSRPAFSTFFTNHVASSLHRYWAARYPDDYRVFSYAPEWVATYKNEIMWTMSKADDMLGRLVKFISRNPGYSLWVASSMGQAATEANEAQKQVYLTHVDTFMQRLGFAAGDWEVRPAMLPRVIIALKNGQGQAFEQKLTGIRIADKGALPWKKIGHDVFRIHPGALQNVREEFCVLDGQRVPFPELGFANVEIQDSTGQSAYHIPQGVLLIYDPQLQPTSTLRPEISTLDIAPRILQSFGLTPPAYMRQETAL